MLRRMHQKLSIWTPLHWQQDKGLSTGTVEEEMELPTTRNSRPVDTYIQGRLLDTGYEMIGRGKPLSEEQIIQHLG